MTARKVVLAGVLAPLFAVVVADRVIRGLNAAIAAATDGMVEAVHDEARSWSPTFPRSLP